MSSTVGLQYLRRGTPTLGGAWTQHQTPRARVTASTGMAGGGRSLITGDATNLGKIRAAVLDGKVANPPLSLKCLSQERKELECSPAKGHRPRRPLESMQEGVPALARLISSTRGSDSREPSCQKYNLFCLYFKRNSCSNPKCFQQEKK